MRDRNVTALLILIAGFMTLLATACGNDPSVNLDDIAVQDDEVDTDTPDIDKDFDLPKDNDLPDGDTPPVEGDDVEADTVDNDIPTAWDEEDADGDGIKNGVEGTDDTDSDGTPDFEDTDSDGDGLPDSTEAPGGLAVDTDKDGTADFRDTDSDNDGLPDGIEGTGDADGDGTANYRDADSDNDNMPDGIECATQPCADTDGDTIPDFLDDDSDADGVLDLYESNKDADGDGLPNYLDTDADGDGIDDAIEKGPDTLPLDSDNDGLYDFRDKDSDNDGLPDASEEYCTTLGKDSRLTADTDGDGYTDLAEKAVGSDLCDAAVRVKDFVDFYFVLPYQQPEQTDVLTFTPTVRKTDIFFNVDTTGSMGGEIGNLKSGLSTVMSEAIARVADSAFGVSKYEDFPVCGFGSGSDKPWTLLQSPTTDTAAAQAAVNALTLGNGDDVPESGYESLYQMASGAGGTFTITATGGCDGDCNETQTIAAYTGTGQGGAGFRAGTLPIALHVTDAASHVPGDYGGTGHHSRDDTVSALNALGVRTITVQSALSTEYDATASTQLTDISDATGARVPVCAFKTGETTWRCGADQCCTLNGGAVAPTGGLCTLRYQVPEDGSSLGTSVVDGIDAIIKYATFNVLSAVKDDGDPMTVDTACFVKKVESLEFVAPPAEPEKSCTPVAAPAAYEGSTYNNGFSNFASGTSSPAKEGSHLLFTVHAQNDTCYEPESSEAVVFAALINIVDQVTGALLDTQTVTIIVPGNTVGGEEN
mgnify:CR=1 FL=1